MLSPKVLELDPAAETDRIVQFLKKTVLETQRRRGAVLGISGGIDSSVVATLCVRAFGKDKVVGLFMNEEDSSDETHRYGRLIAEHLQIKTFDENITPMLRELGCYRRRDEAIKSVVPEYGPGYKSKIVLPSVVDSDAYRVFSVVVQPPGGGPTIKARLSPHAYLEIVASTNFKQRTRKMLEYYYADRFVYSVAGTPNLLEYDQGFFVKNGDGAADVKPIAHLYKTQVYALARHLGVPAEICARPPTTDTYSMPQTQEEFYFSLPYDKMDLCLYGKNHGMSAAEVAPALGLEAAQVERVFRDIDAKRAVAKYLHMPPMVLKTDG